MGWASLVLRPCQGGSIAIRRRAILDSEKHTPPENFFLQPLARRHILDTQAQHLLHGPAKGVRFR